MSSQPEQNPASIRLTPTESEWLVKMSVSHERRLSLLADNPPKRAMNGLVKKGLARNIMNVFWEITELGVKRCTSIY